MEGIEGIDEERWCTSGRERRRNLCADVATLAYSRYDNFPLAVVDEFYRTYEIPTKKLVTR